LETIPKKHDPPFGPATVHPSARRQNLDTCYVEWPEVGPILNRHQPRRRPHDLPLDFRHRCPWRYAGFQDRRSTHSAPPRQKGVRTLWRRVGGWLTRWMPRPNAATKRMRAIHALNLCNVTIGHCFSQGRRTTKRLRIFLPEGLVAIPCRISFVSVDAENHWHFVLSTDRRRRNEISCVGSTLTHTMR